MGQAVPHVVESKVLPHVLAMDHEAGKVSLHIEDDPGGKAHEKAQREPQHMRSPERPLVVPEPKPQQGQEGEPVDVCKPESKPSSESQEHWIRR